MPEGLRCMLCQSEKDVTALPVDPEDIAGCRAVFGIAPTPGLCAKCRALPRDEHLALFLHVLEDTVNRFAATTGKSPAEARFITSQILAALVERAREREERTVR